MSTIKTRYLSKEGRDNWDKIFVKKPIKEWIQQLYPNCQDFKDTQMDDTPISRIEFERLFTRFSEEQ